jgi:hypothetical protein
MKRFAFAFGTAIISGFVAIFPASGDAQVPTPINSTVSETKFVKILMKASAPEKLKTYISGSLVVDKSLGTIKSLTVNLQPGAACAPGKQCLSELLPPQEVTTLAIRKVTSGECGDFYLAERNAMPTEGIDQIIKVADYSNGNGSSSCSRHSSHPISVEFTTLQFDRKQGALVETTYLMNGDEWK